MANSTQTITNQTQPTHLPGWRKWMPVVILSLGLMIIILDSTILNVSFSYLIRDLHTDLQSLQWVITAYSLTLAALTITGGRLGDFFGRKKMFVIGAITFAIGSFITSISQSVGVMIIGESIIEGIGAAMMMPATMSILVSTYRGRDRAIAMGFWGGIAAASSAIGPIIGGFLTTNYSWRWGFRVNIFVALILVIGSLFLTEYRDEEEKPSLDLIGVLISSLGLVSFVFGVIESSQYGWWKAKEVFVAFAHQINFGYFSITPVTMLIGIILIGLFILWENHVECQGGTPLVSLELFKNRQFTSGAITTAVMATGQAGLIFSLPIFFQAVRGLDAYHTGLAIIPLSVTALIIAPLSAFINKHVHPKYLIQLGLILGAAGFMLMRQELNVNATSHNLIPGLILYGISIGLVMAQLNNMTISAVSPQEAGEASGVNNTMRQIGSSFGSAIIGAILLTSLGNNLTSGINNSTIIPNLLKNQISTAVAGQTSNVEFGGGAKLPDQVPPAITNEIIKISHQATTDANRQAILYAVFLNLLGFIVSFWLPKATNIEKDSSAIHHA
jgi:EmrB/QacA subfamily drug resistance transporter